LLPLVIFASAAWADSLAIVAGETRLVLTRNPMSFAVEYHGAPAAEAHTEGGLLLGEPDHPQPASIESESFDAAGRREFSLSGTF